MMKKVLFISYFFPPLGGGGVQRSVKFAKYLPWFDWQPTILTVKGIDYSAYDHSLLDQLPGGVKLHRSGSLDPARISKILRSLLRRSESVPKSNSSDSGARGIYRIVPPGIRTFLDAWFFFPDNKIGWLPFAVAKGIRIAKTEDVSAIYSSSPPVTGHLVAYLIKVFTRVPWVADFRDPWTENPFLDSKTSLRKRAEGFLERKVVGKADNIILNTEVSREIFVGKYEDQYPGKFITIMNGFDPEDFKDLDASSCSSDNEKLTITYAGALYGKRNCEPLLLGTRKMLSKHPDVAQGVDINLIGLISSANQKLVDKLGLEKVVHVQGYQLHEKCLRSLCRSDVLLLITSPEEGAGTIPGKLFEYFGIGRPIMALTSGREIIDLINRTKSGVIVSPDDVDDISTSIYETYLKFKDGSLAGNVAKKGALDEFTRKELAKKLGECFDQVLDGPVRNHKRSS